MEKYLTKKGIDVSDNHVNLHQFLIVSGISNCPKNYSTNKKKVPKDKVCYIKGEKHIPFTLMFELLSNAKKKSVKQFNEKLQKHVVKTNDNKDKTNVKVIEEAHNDPIKVEEEKSEQNDELDGVEDLTSDIGEEEINCEKPDLLKNLTMMNINDCSKSNYINFGDYKIAVVVVNEDEIYFKGKDVCRALEYVDTTLAIAKYVKIGTCKQLAKSLLEKMKSCSNRCDYIFLKNEHPNTVFINEAGLYTLIMRSRMKKAEEFQVWLTQKVLPNLRKHGSYRIQPVKRDFTEYRVYDLASYDRFQVFYIFYIGVVRGVQLFKYGITKNIYTRYSEHIDTYCEKSSEHTMYPILVEKCQNNQDVESRFGSELTHINLKLNKEDFHFKGKNRVELFTLSSEYGLDFVLNKTKSIIANTKSPEMYEVEINEYKREIENVIANKDHEIKLRDMLVQERDTIIQNKDTLINTLIKNKDEIIQNKDMLIETSRMLIESKDEIIKELREKIIK